VTANTGSFTKSDGSTGALSDVALSYATDAAISAPPPTTARYAPARFARNLRWGVSEFGTFDIDRVEPTMTIGSDGTVAAVRSASALVQAMSMFGASRAADFSGRHDMVYSVEPLTVADAGHRRMAMGSQSALL
nr:hypothetical protein [Sphingomonadaceae bacterium]